ncbi:MAG TPA: 3-phosphoshikimate 1-carboxyvinyltransferase [Candidatus Nitrosotenuis sp.]|nr:3-phosphoshikimate 1-carboxyvinyltransferase [Candidatus Nitrosotenuis sp.]
MSIETIHPATRLNGIISVSGDKSISHRYAILSALAEGTSEIQNYSPAEDCASTLECLRGLGVELQVSGTRVTIRSAGLRGFKAPRRKLDAGNSGTTMRLLAGVLAGQPFDSEITGDSSLRRRPMRRVIEPLAQMGAEIRARNGEFAPLEIYGRSLRAVRYELPVASAQVKSAILLAGLMAEGETQVIEPVRTRDHTELALVEFGVDLRKGMRSTTICGPAKLQPRSLTVPGDFSSAIFFLAAALVVPESQLVVSGVGLNPTRTAALDVLASMGAPIHLTNLSLMHGEVVGDVSIRHAPLRGGRVTGPTIPQLIDELPVLAALGPFTEEGIEIRDAKELRVKESDRISVLAENLRRFGATVEEFEDGLRVSGRASTTLSGAEVDPNGDHRMAMALAVAALGARGDSRIRDAQCAAVSFPGFFSTLKKLTGQQGD